MESVSIEIEIEYNEQPTNSNMVSVHFWSAAHQVTSNKQQ